MLAEAPRIALVKLSSLGDVVHALPLAATLRAARPAARLTWIVERREAAILREHPALDEVVVADTRGWRRARSAGALGADPARDARAAAPAGRRALRRRHRRAGAHQERGAGGRHPGARADRLRRGPSSASRSARCSPPTRVTPPPTAAHVVDQYLALLGRARHHRSAARVPAAVVAGGRGARRRVAGRRRHQAAPPAGDPESRRRPRGQAVAGRLTSRRWPAASSTTAARTW